MSESDRSTVIQIISDGLDRAGANPDSKRNIIDIVENDAVFQSKFVGKGDTIHFSLPLTDVFGPTLKPYTVSSTISDHFIPGDEAAFATVSIQVDDRIRITSREGYDQEKVISKVKEYLSHDNVLREIGQELDRRRFEKATQNLIPAEVAIMMIATGNKDLLDNATEEQLKVLGQAAREIDATLEANLAKAITSATRDDPTVTMNWGFFDGLTNTIREERKLTQFLGVGLRDVLPYAERDVFASETRDSNAHRAITRAQAALNRLEATDLKIKDVPNDAFDDDFQVIFDDEDE